MTAPNATRAATTAIVMRSTWLAPSPVEITTIAGAMSSATRFMTLMSGLIAGPAVSLNGSPTVSPITTASCAGEFFPP
mgnify:CR=1 FL=1